MTAEIGPTQWLWSLVQFYGAPIVLLAVSGAYFFADRTGSSLSKRVLTSAHGVTAVLIFAAAFVVGATGNARPTYGTPYLLVNLIPVALICVSFALYQGPKLLHLLQLANVAAILWLLFVGSMAVTGSWL